MLDPVYCLHASLAGQSNAETKCTYSYSIVQKPHTHNTHVFNVIVIRYELYLKIVNNVAYSIDVA